MCGHISMIFVTLLAITHGEKLEPIGGSTEGADFREERQSYLPERSTTDQKADTYLYLNMQRIKFENCYNEQILKRNLYTNRRSGLGVTKMKNNGYGTLVDCIQILQETLKAPQIADSTEVFRKILKHSIVGATKQKSKRGNVNDLYRIIGGNDALDGEYPYMVSLRIKMIHLCGASIINKRWVLTAGHCVYNRDIDNMRIVVGTNKLKANGDIYSAKVAVTHPNYDYTKLRNDIGLVRLENDIIFTWKVQPVSLPTGKCVPCDNCQAVATGWGFTSYPGTFSNELQSFVFTVISRKECQSYRKRKVQGAQICTRPKIGEGVCQADSGSPLVAHGVQIGVVSSGTACGIGLPDLYAYVCKFITWINKNIAE